jgi:hypothetical protein
MPAKRLEMRTFGSCEVLFEKIPSPDYAESAHFHYLINFGGVGDVKVTTKRTIVEDKDGTPQSVSVADVSEEEAVIEITLKEQSPLERQARLGAGLVGSDVAESGKSDTEYKKLTGTAFENLLSRDATSITVTKIDQTTLLPAATPVLYTLYDADTGLGDYVIGTQQGGDALRRVTGSAIASDEIVKVDYTWNKPAAETFSYGGENTINYYRMLLIKKTRNDPRVLHYFWQVYAEGQDVLEMLSTAHPKSTVNFKAMHDSSKDDGEKLYKSVYEST